MPSEQSEPYKSESGAWHLASSSPERKIQDRKLSSRRGGEIRDSGQKMRKLEISVENLITNWKTRDFGGLHGARY